MNVDPEIEALLGPAAHDAGPAVVPPLGSPAGGGSDLAMGAFEGASRFDKSLALWGPAMRSADADILPEKRTIDSRVRDSIRNDAYVAGGAVLHQDNIVGAAFTLNSKPALKALGSKFDEKWEEEFQEEVEEKFTLAAESQDCWLDGSRMNGLTSQVRLAVGVFCAAGEVLASAEWVRDSGRPFNTAMQMIDLDRLSNPPGLDQRTARGGIEKDARGAPIAYHVRMAHPSDFGNADAYQWKRVPVRKPWGRLQMLHIVEQKRVDQSRGISDMVAALKEMRITKKFRDVVLQNAVLNASYAASIESDLPSETVFQQLGGGNVGSTDVGEAITNYATGYLGAIAEYAGGAKNMQIDGVKIPHLFPGTKLQLRPAGNGGPLGNDFEQSLLRYIAANLGVSYEQLSRDYTKTNYSSARAAMSETWKFMQSRKKMVADRYATTVYRLWLEEQINKGLISSMPRMREGWLYEGLNLDALAQCDWIGASRGQIDELKETQAAVLRINNGLSTLEYELSRLGMDWRKVVRQLAREDRTLKAAGVNLLARTDTTNQMNAASGAPRDKTASAADVAELLDRMSALEERIAA